MNITVKKIFVPILVSIFFVLPAISQAQTQEVTTNPVNIYFFYSESCPHCRAESQFISEIEIEFEYDNVVFNQYEVTEESELFGKFNSITGYQLTGIPATFIGEQFFVGWSTDEISGQEMRNLINHCLVNDCEDVGKKIISGEIEFEKVAEESETQVELIESNIIHIPILGSVDIGQYSLLGLTVVLAAVDGFNPCAMWVLLILISMLLGMKDRRRMWILGLSFIAASAFVYFIFLAAWFNFFKFIGIVRWVQVLVGIFAAGVGVFYLRRFWKSRPGECEVTNPEQKRKITDKLRQIVHERGIWLALAGIIGLAFVVNLIELACSAGLPAIFTQVIALNDLTGLQYYGYLLLYIFIFMLDDMIIFAIAMITLKAVGTTGKYSRYATLIGGVIIFIIGILLMIKPELVMIG
ncbi:MAG: hypothetical protein ACNFW9_04325 [Candidatus Kerfeldbacteria bacterium]